MSKTVSTYHLVTFGCQMNKYDSEKIEGLLQSQGIMPVETAESAELILLNTCSIREKAENKVFSHIGRLAPLKKTGRLPLIGLGGCMATLRKKDIFKMAPALDFAFGPDSINALPELIASALKGDKKQVKATFTQQTTWDRPEDNVRQNAVVGWVGIMKGCDNRCSYCVVPSTRGREISRPMESILAEVNDLAGKGYKEVNLLGQNVNSYGKGLVEEVTFPELLKKVEAVDGIERVRFMTSHPKDLTDELIEAMAGSKKIMPSIHLPMQSGSDRILKLMGRGYSASLYLSKVKKLKKAIKGLTISTDLMVGYPTETDEDFRETMKVMNEVKFDALFLFIYSKRPGTKSAEQKSEVSKKVAVSRFKEAYSFYEKTVVKRNKNLVGTTIEVLCEGQYNGAKVSQAGLFANFGRSRDNINVVFNSEKNLTGMTLDVKINSVARFNLVGELFTQPALNIRNAV